MSGLLYSIFQLQKSNQEIKKMTTEPQTLGNIADIFMWIYCILIVVAMSCQIFTTWRRRNVAGLSFDFLHYSLIGYFCLFIFSTAYSFSDEVRTTYQSRMGSDVYPATKSDFILSLICLVLTFILIYQCFSYNKYEKKSISLICIIIVSCEWMVLILAIVAYMVSFHITVNGGEHTFQFLDLLNTCGYIFILSMILRFIPQISLNFRRRSTKGFSLEFVILLLVGSVFLLSNVLVNSVIQNGVGNWKSADISKAILVASIMFSATVLIIQHYTCCSDKNSEYELNRGELMREQEILISRMIYDEDENLQSIGRYRLYEDYDPSVIGRVSESDGEVYMSNGERSRKQDLLFDSRFSSVENYSEEGSEDFDNFYDNINNL